MCSMYSKLYKTNIDNNHNNFIDTIDKSTDVPTHSLVSKRNITLNSSRTESRLYFEISYSKARPYIAALMLFLSQRVVILMYYGIIVNIIVFGCISCLLFIEDWRCPLLVNNVQKKTLSEVVICFVEIVLIVLAATCG